MNQECLTEQGRLNPDCGAGFCPVSSQTGRPASMLDCRACTARPAAPRPRWRERWRARWRRFARDYRENFLIYVDNGKGGQGQEAEREAELHDGIKDLVERVWPGGRFIVIVVHGNHEPAAGGGGAAGGPQPGAVSNRIRSA